MNPICVLMIKWCSFRSSHTERLPPVHAGKICNQKGTGGGWMFWRAFPLSWSHWSKIIAQGSSPWSTEKVSYATLLNWCRERKGLWGAWEKSWGQRDGGNFSIPVSFKALSWSSTSSQSPPHPPHFLLWNNPAGSMWELAPYPLSTIGLLVHGACGRRERPAGVLEQMSQPWGQ